MKLLWVGSKTGLLVSVALLTAGLQADLRADTDPTRFGLVPPLTITRAAIYSDGGTVMFEIRDLHGHALIGGFDGRMQAVREPWVDNTYPWHCYVGAGHPTEPTARLLTLWGEEERSLIRILNLAINAALTPQEKQRLLAVTSAMDLPDSRTIGLWHLVRRTAERERLLEAIDRGRLALDDCLRSYIEATLPITLRSVVFVDSTACFEISLCDDVGRMIAMSLPADSAGSDFRPTVIRDRYKMTYPIGTLGDRCLLTMLNLAVRSRADHEESFVGSEPVEALMETALTRTRRILAADAAR